MADWDTFSEDYDAIFLENPLYVDTIQQMLTKVEGADGLRALDLGCGTGNVTAALVEWAAASAIEIVAVDPSEGMRARCAARFAGVESVEVAEGHALGIPVPADSFDCAVSNLALHHVPPDERAACAAELFRVLKPGGRLVYADMFCDVDADPRNPVRVKDIVDKIVGVAMYCLDHGAYDMMQVMFSTLPADISGEGEYMTTGGVWKDLLEAAGFAAVGVHGVPPVEFGIKIIVADKL